MYTLLVVDDDPGISALLVEYLGSRGFAVESTSNGSDGLLRLARGGVDLVILDVMMPGMDGFETCRAIRRADRSISQVPIIMLTARGDDFDRIVGLELGADDYLPKPFNPRELLARVQAVLRRSTSDSAESDPVLRAAGIRMDAARRECTVHGEMVDLTTTEFDLLHALVAAAGRVIPRESLMATARGDAYASFDRSVDVHVSHIRRKLGDNPKKPQMIKTVRGVGYLVPRDTSE
ncbi:MAG: DNA-binding response regulator [Deltaproteobacteria bacterium]|nr:DNA-binding response regulator [Deltaproteobacteria bacterium]